MRPHKARFIGGVEKGVAPDKVRLLFLCLELSMPRALSLIAVFLAAPAPLLAKPNPEAPVSMTSPFSYPDTKRDDTVDEQFGVKVADPYRWLENDVRIDPEVKAWVDAENT